MTTEIGNREPQQNYRRGTVSNLLLGHNLLFWVQPRPQFLKLNKAFMWLGLKKIGVFPLTCRKNCGSVGRKIFLFFFNFYLIKLGLKCFSGLHFTKLIGKPLIMRFSTSGKKMGYKCINFPMLENIISIYGLRTG